jgi:rubredoxin
LPAPEPIHPDEAADNPPAVRRSALRCGEPCPACGKGVLDYNGLLDLECPLCGFTQGAGGGCT